MFAKDYFKCFVLFIAIGSVCIYAFNSNPRILTENGKVIGTSCFIPSSFCSEYGNSFEVEHYLVGSHKYYDNKTPVDIEYRVGCKNKDYSYQVKIFFEALCEIQVSEHSKNITYDIFVDENSNTQLVFYTSGEMGDWKEIKIQMLAPDIPSVKIQAIVTVLNESKYERTPYAMDLKHFHTEGQLIIEISKYKRITKQLDDDIAIVTNSADVMQLRNIKRKKASNFEVMMERHSRFLDIINRGAISAARVDMYNSAVDEYVNKYQLLDDAIKSRLDMIDEPSHSPPITPPGTPGEFRVYPNFDSYNRLPNDIWRRVGINHRSCVFWLYYEGDTTPLPYTPALLADEGNTEATIINLGSNKFQILGGPTAEVGTVQWRPNSDLSLVVSMGTLNCTGSGHYN